MKYTKTLILAFLLPLNLLSQIDMMDEGLASCMDASSLVFINELVTELEDYTFQQFDIENNDYSKLTEVICSEENLPSFKVEPNSNLDKLIKTGIKSKFWKYTTFAPSDSTVIAGETAHITPPKNTENEQVSNNEIEQAFIDPQNEYIVCSKDYAFQTGLLIFYKTYESFMSASSNLKLCGLKDFFSQEDYNLTSIKHFILVHCICQKIIHENNYYDQF